MLALKTSIFRPAHEKVNFDPSTKNSPHIKTKSIYIPTQSQVNFDPNIGVKSISISTLKTSQFGILSHRNQVNFLADSTQVIFDPYTKSSQLQSLQWNQGNSYPPPLKSRLLRLPTQQRSQFRCQHLNLVIFGPCYCKCLHSSCHTAAIRVYYNII